MEFRNHSMQVTIGALGSNDNPTEEAFPLGPKVYRWHVILAQDLETFVAKAVFSDHPQVGIPLINPKEQLYQTRARLHLRDPRPLKFRHDTYQPRLSWQAQNRLILPFTKWNSRDVSDEERQLLSSSQTPISVQLKDVTDLMEMPIEVITEEGLEAPGFEDIKKTLEVDRLKPINPGLQLERTRQLLADGDMKLEVPGREAEAIALYRLAYATMDILFIDDVDRELAGLEFCSRSNEYNVMLGSPVNQVDDPALSPQNVLSDGSIAHPSQYHWAHWRVEGVCPDSQGHWNHAAWERENLSTILRSRLVCALQRSGQLEEAQMWAMTMIVGIWEQHRHRNPTSSRPFDLDPVFEAHIHAPAPTAAGEIYFRGAMMVSVKENLDFNVTFSACDLLQVAAYYLAGDIGLAERLANEFSTVIDRERFMKIVRRSELARREDGLLG